MLSTNSGGVPTYLPKFEFPNLTISSNLACSSVSLFLFSATRRSTYQKQNMKQESKSFNFFFFFKTSCMSLLSTSALISFHT